MSAPIANRQELIHNAVAFLSDPQTQMSTLAQRIQFLEAKGLTQSEIDTALKQASVNATRPSPSTWNPHSPSSPVRWDWRDYFIMTVVSGTIAYGAVSMFKKFLLPYLQPPNVTAYEADRDALTAQFDAAEALLKEIQMESASMWATLEEQTEKVNKATQDVDAAVKMMHEGQNKTRDEMREIRDEINTIRDMLPKMIEKNKESHSQSLAELQQELKSLKALLLSRGPSVAGATSPMPMLGRPSIPAWQLAGAAPSNEGEVTEIPA